MQNNEQDLKVVAETFAKKFSSGVDISSKDVVPVYDNENNLIGCSVSYYCKDIPYGYINFDLRYGITEFSIHEGVLSLYDEMMEQAIEDDNSIKKSNGTKKIYNVAPLDYYGSYKENNKEEKFVEYGRKEKYFSKKEFSSIQESYENIEPDYVESTKYSGFKEVMKTASQAGAIKVSNKLMGKYNKSKSLVSQTQSETAAKKYACGVTALTAIAQQEGVAKSTFKATYNSLWSYTGTTETASSKKNRDAGKSTITYGSTDTDYLAIGMRSYCKENGEKSTTTSTSSNPTISYYQSAVDSNISSILSIFIKKTNGTTAGHCVSVVGYAKFAANTSMISSPSNYVAIANGWDNDAPRYVSLTGIDFTSKSGIKYTIK